MRRFFAYPLVRLVLVIAAFAAGMGALAAIAHATGLPRSLPAIEWATLAVLVSAIFIVEHFTVARGPREIGFDPRYAVRDTLLGLAVGTALFSAVVAELAGAHAYRIDGLHPSLAPLQSALWLVPAAAVEEVLFRGAIFRLVAEWSGTWIAIAVSAGLFGAVHAFNPGATWFSSAAIALEAGVMLAAAFVVTRSLWFPIAIHFAWNFCEGPRYGTQLSGITVGRALADAHVAGPAWLTGGSFGPEAGVPALLTCSSAAAAFLVIAYRTGSIVRCPWFRPARAYSR